MCWKWRRTNIGRDLYALLVFYLALVANETFDYQPVPNLAEFRVVVHGQILDAVVKFDIIQAFSDGLTGSTINST